MLNNACKNQMGALENATQRSFLILIMKCHPWASWGAALPYGMITDHVTLWKPQESPWGVRTFYLCSEPGWPVLSADWHPIVSLGPYTWMLLLCFDSLERHVGIVGRRRVGYIQNVQGGPWGPSDENPTLS